MCGRQLPDLIIVSPAASVCSVQPEWPPASASVVGDGLTLAVGHPRGGIRSRGPSRTDPRHPEQEVRRAEKGNNDPLEGSLKR